MVIAATLLLVLALVVAAWYAAVRFRAGGRTETPLAKGSALWLSSAPLRKLPYESLVVVGVSAAVIFLLTFPAFSGFFIAEDFTYLGNYQSAGHHFLAGIFTPINHIFLRPSAAAWYLVFYHFLPVEPLAHHLRNWVTTVLAAGLLYALLRRLVASPLARAIGIAFFVVSKVHLVTVGYINCNDSIMSIIQIEATLYLLIVYFQTERSLWLYLSFIPFTLEVFSRDYGVAILAMVATAILIQARGARKPWMFVARLIGPFAGIAALYFGIRFVILSRDAIRSTPAYRLNFSALPILYRVWIFGGNVFNVSLGEVQVSGSGSFATILHAIFPGIVRETRPWDIAFAVSASILVLTMIGLALRKDERIWIPIVWGAAFITPTFLIANIQVYYILESVAAVALLIALCLDALPGRFWTYACISVLGLAAINSAMESRFVNVYSWRFCANAARKAYDEAIGLYRGHALRSWTLFVPNEAQLGFWSYTLTADGTCPMIQTLLGLPNLRVTLTKPHALTPQELRLDDSPVYLVSNGELLRLTQLLINGVLPVRSRADGKLTLSADGRAEIWINCQNALPTTIVFWNGEALTTEFGSSHGLTALVPPRLLSAPGTANVSIRDPQSGSESAPFAFHLTATEQAARPVLR